MKRKFSLLVIMLLFLLSSNAQKKLIDSSVYDKWPRDILSFISTDGKYFWSTTQDPVTFTDTLSVYSAYFKWQLHIPGASSPLCTQDNSKIIFKKRDSLFVLTLKTAQIAELGPVAGGIQTIHQTGKSDLLAYVADNHPDKLLLRDVQVGSLQMIEKYDHYWYDPGQRLLIFQTIDSVGGGFLYHLSTYDPDTGKRLLFYAGDKVENLVFANNGTSIAFISRGKEKRGVIWYFNTGTASPVELLKDHSDRISHNLLIDNLRGINEKDKEIFFSLKDTSNEPVNNPIAVDVWNYKDPKLQSQQLSEMKEGRSLQSFNAMIRIDNGLVVPLENEDQQVIKWTPGALPRNWILIRQLGPGDVREWNWNRNANVSNYLLSLKDGSKLLIKKNTPFVTSYSYSLSPDEKFVIYYDPGKRSYYSYNVEKGVYSNITSTTRADWTPFERNDENEGSMYSYRLGGYSKDMQHVFLYDRFDIYLADLTGKTSPLNLTGGYGKTHNIVFRIAFDELGYTGSDQRYYDPGKIFLYAFNRKTKDEGFFSLDSSAYNKLRCLTMQPFHLTRIVKAEQANAFLVQMMDEKTPDNLFFTRDLKQFNLVSNLHPNKGFNWLSAELINYKQLDGKATQGVLYKPENFDSTKKYPLIICYYERRSDELHHFLNPNTQNSEIDIPYYVSNGFLVFTPDIFYTIGQPGRSAYNSIMAAADLLSNRKFIDKNKIGLQGHSFGGFETNYVITHTPRFAAAMSSCGMSNFVSAFNSIILEFGVSRQHQYEVSRDRMGGTLWSKKSKYLENSPVLCADRVKTPLLMMANQLDEDVPYAQGTEFYLALRRLNRKVWMLQYDSQGHGLQDYTAQSDLTIRVFQFFNHYLKGAPPPIWMTEGVPAKKKAMFSGLDLDTSGRKP